MFRDLCFVCSMLALVVVPSADAQTSTAVEYYNHALDHYFVTASASEIESLDTGRIAGWTRTGQTFEVLAPTAPGAMGVSPVCRFYGMPGAGLDSHFYSASPEECARVAANFPAWKFESGNVFQVYLADPQTGECPGNTVPVYRSFNARRDANHRYTTDAAIHDQMVANGSIAEGYGDPPVAMCVPQASGAPPITGPAPACAVTASATVAAIGSAVTLTAYCNNAPTSYSWEGCASSGPVCIATSSASGRVRYTVTATNAAGSGSASTTVLWQPELTNATNLRCTLTASPSVAFVGAPVTLTAACTGGNVARYIWSGCSSTGPDCIATASTPGRVTYAVSGVDDNGVPSAPATASVLWQ